MTADVCKACGFALSYGPALNDEHVDCYSAWQRGLDLQLDALQALGVEVEILGAKIETALGPAESEGA